MKNHIFIEEFIPDSFFKKLYFEKIGLFKKMENRIVLDIGCHTGYFGHLISCYSNKYFGIDVNKENINACRRSGIKGIFIQADAIKIPLPEASVDFIFCSDTLEHIRDYKRALCEFERLLTPDGLLFINFPIWPNFFLTRRFTDLVERINRLYYGQSHPQAHKQRLNLEEITKLLKKLGFKILKKERAKSSLATFIGDGIILFEKIHRMIFLRKAGEDFKLLDQKGRASSVQGKLWQRLFLPIIQTIIKIDFMLKPDGDNMGVILAQK